MFEESYHYTDKIAYYCVLIHDGGKMRVLARFVFVLVIQLSTFRVYSHLLETVSLYGWLVRVFAAVNKIIAEKWWSRYLFKNIYIV